MSRLLIIGCGGVAGVARTAMFLQKFALQAGQNQSVTL